MKFSEGDEVRFVVDETEGFLKQYDSQAGHIEYGGVNGDGIPTYDVRLNYSGEVIRKVSESLLEEF